MDDNYEVKWVDGNWEQNVPGYWAIFKNGVQFSPYGFESEIEAIEEVAVTIGSRIADRLWKRHSSVQ